VERTRCGCVIARPFIVSFMEERRV
jgi:hypothetical protein